MIVSPYAAYKNSNVDWMGSVPADWTLVPLKWFATLITGMTPSTDNPSNYADEPGDFPWLRPEDLVESGVASRASKFVSAQGWNTARVVPSGATLVCCIGTVGKVGIVQRACNTNQQITAVKSKGHDRYFFYSLLASKVELVASAVGNTLPILNGERLGRVVLPRPPSEEQRQIADYLDAHTAKIDTLIAKQERLIETLAERRQAVISHAVTKGLNPNVTIKNSGVEWLSAIPDTWTIPRVAHHFSIVLGKMVNAGKVNEPGLFDAPYLRAGNVQPYGVDITEAKTMPMSAAELTQLSLRIGDLVVVEGGQGGYGRSALVLADLSGWGYQNHVMRVRPKSYESNAFLDYVIKALRAAGYIASLSSHASLPSFSAEKLAAIRYGRPPVSEQGAIVEYLDHETTQIDALSAKAREMIDVLKERRQALISAAVTGKIDVRGLA